MKVYKVNEHLFEKSNKFIGEKEVDWMRYVTLQQGTGGSISANPLSGRKGTIVNLSQTTNTDYRFDGYSITGANLSSNKFAINDGDVTAQGIFTYYPKRSVTVTQQTGGTVVANPTTGHDGDTVTLSNTANAHYTFGSYSITGATLTGSQFKFNGGNVTAKGSFIADPVRTITLQSTSGGTINANKLTGYDGDVITLSQTANAGYTFNNYSITGATLTGNQFTLTGGNVTAQPNYTLSVYSLTLHTNGHGKLVAGKTTGHYNDTTTLTATPSAGYAFNSYSITGGSITNNTYKWGTTNGTVKANFSITGGITIGSQVWNKYDMDYIPPSMVLYSDTTSTIDYGGYRLNTKEYSAVDTLHDGNSYIIENIKIFNSGGSAHEGIMYNYNAACSAAEHYPGWRIPTSAEWDTLRTYAGGWNSAGYRLKSTADGGNDQYGFCITGTSNGSPSYGTSDFYLPNSQWIFYVNRNYNWLKDTHDGYYTRYRLIID